MRRRRLFSTLAIASGGLVVLLGAIGFIADTLNDDEPAPAPLNEIALDDMAGWMVLFGLAAVLFFTLSRAGGGEESRARRWALRGALAVGLVAVGAVAAVLLLLAAMSGNE